MKNIVSILLALLILFQSFSKVWIVGSFKINQNYIAKVLCVNRDKPELLCSGKCFLKKQIKTEEEKEKNGAAPNLKEHKEVLYCLNNFDWLVSYHVDWADNPQKTFSHQTPFTSVFVRGIFRPPEFVTI